MTGSRCAKDVRRGDVVDDRVVEWAAWCHVERTVTWWWYGDDGYLTTATRSWGDVVDVSGVDRPHCPRGAMAAIGRAWLSSPCHAHHDVDEATTEHAGTPDPAAPAGRTSLDGPVAKRLEPDR